MNRPKKISANPGRASIDIGGIAGAAGMTAPTGGGINSALDPNTGVDLSDEAAMSNNVGIDPKGDTNGLSMPANFQPYKATGWQNLLSRGQAGMQANALNNAILLQQLQGQNALARTGLENQGRLDVTKLEGANQQHNIVTTGEQGRLTSAQAAQEAATQAKLKADIDYAAAHGINLASVPNAIQMLDPKQIAVTGQQSDNNLQLLKLIANAQNPALNPQAQANVTAGFNATQFAPAAKNMALTGNPIGLNQVAFPISSFGNPTLQLGNQSQGTTTTVSRDPNNPFSVSTNEKLNLSQGGQFQLNDKGQRVIPIVGGNNQNAASGNFGVNNLTQPADDTMQFLNNLPPQQQTQPSVNPKGVDVGTDNYYGNPAAYFFKKLFPNNVFNGQQY